MALQSTPTHLDDVNVTWLNRFLEEEQNIFFCRVDDSFMGERFELFDLDQMVANYPLALNFIRNRKKAEYYNTTKEHQAVIQRDAELLYGLIHARFIITKAGFNRMKEKYYRKHFGVCHRDGCAQQPLLPVGLTSEIKKETVRLYCASCNDIYIPFKQVHRGIDGAYFGTTFAHFFLLTFPKLKPRQKSTNTHYIPKIFGFSLHESWHERALGYGRDNRTRDETETKDRDLVYLKTLKEKHIAEISRLHDIVKKQKTDAEKANAVKKKHALRLLSAQTQIAMLRQQTLSNGNTKNIGSGAPLPPPLPSTANDHKIDFGDILNELCKTLNVVKDQYDVRAQDDTLKEYKDELDRICKLSDSVKAYVNTLQN